MGLERFIQLSIRVASRMHSCMKDQQSLTHSNPLLRRPGNISPPEPVPEPMLVDNTRLSLTERHRRLSQGLCLYCGASGHTITSCPVRPPRLMVSAITPQVTNMCPLTTVVQLTAHDVSLSVVALIDSGSAANFIAGTLSRQLAIETAENLLNQVFRYFGIPEDIVSDRGHQFISRVWKAFFSLLNVTVSLSSGYHPQTNGQTERKVQEIG